VKDAPEPPPAKIVVKLADGKARTIQSMVQTTFWDPSGTPLTALEFLESLFGALPLLRAPRAVGGQLTLDWAAWRPANTMSS
jgi:hypothetical protein